MRLKMLLLYLCAASFLMAQPKPSQEWLDQKYSMFIHFGLYSEYGGVYDGKPVERGYSEQIQSFAGIFSDWYGNTANKFNPEKWNPDEVVKLAKDAGMKSIVITSKHHDGFCMYHSQYTDFNIVDATPYGKDLMKELAEACERGGIGFGVYYSLIDWHFPHAYPISSHNADPLTQEHYEFNMKQVEEIMTNYGPVSEIWFDMGSLTPEQSKGLYELVDRLQPNCMISGRLGNDYVDFAVMADNEYPDYKMGVPWQTAASIFDETWGYRSWQERGETKDKIDEKIASLVKVISRGGNFLLNIGPRGDGSIVEFERDVLLGIGQWVKENSEAIYASHSNPFDHPFSFGDMTTNNGNLYTFVSNIPADNNINIDGFNGKVKSVSVLGSGQSVDFAQKGNSLRVNLSGLTKTDNVPVLKVEFENGFTTVPSSIVTKGMLTPHNSNKLFGHSSLNYYAGYKSLVGYEWSVKSGKKQVSPSIYYTDNEKGREIEISSADVNNNVTLEPTSSKTVYLPKNSVQLGSLYRQPGRGVFGNMPDEGTEVIDVTQDKSWKPVSDFEYGKSVTEKILPRASVIFLQNVHSTREQEVAIEVESGNAVYILLNGEYITAHFSPNRIKSQKEIVMLPLKKGDNQLMIKYYNGFEKEFSYGFKLLNEWTVYSQKVATMPFSGDIKVKALGADSSVTPLRLNNISIKL